MPGDNARKKIAVVGTGISGLSAAWLLSGRHDVTVYERASRIGGHSNTVTVTENGREIPVDTGFIVYNEPNYPNLGAMFRHLGVATHASDMSFAVSLAGGRLEYAGKDMASLFAQKRNILSPRFWSMLRDLVRFYRTAAIDIDALDPDHTLGDYLAARGYGTPFRDDHLLPMAGAIWSAPCSAILGYPAGSFIRFFDNHGLLRLAGRPQWRTVTNGSRSYVDALAEPLTGRIRCNSRIESIRRIGGDVVVSDARHGSERFDAIVIASHADQALSLLADPSAEERSLLGAFRYSRNSAFLHTDPSVMPRRRAVWASWNHVEGPAGPHEEVPTVTYWMNRLQSLRSEKPLFVTLNPHAPLDPSQVLHEEEYEHPLFDGAAVAAQRRLWSLQGQRNTWFCGSYFGSGFHEDALQSGLAAAEALGGVRRPWSVADESGRIFLSGETVAPGAIANVPATRAEEIAA